MTQQSGQAKLARTRTGVATNTGEINDVAINGMTATTKTIQHFVLAITQMSRQALDRTTQHIEKLRKAHNMQEITSIERDFVNESLDHTLQHIKLIEILADLRLEGARPNQDDWLQSVIAVVETTEAAGYAAATSVERLSGVARRA